MKSYYDMQVKKNADGSITINLGKVASKEENDAFQEIFCTKEGEFMTWEADLKIIQFKKELSEKILIAKDPLLTPISSQNEDADVIPPIRPAQYAVTMCANNVAYQIIANAHIFDMPLPSSIRIGEIVFTVTDNNINSMATLLFT